MRPATPGAFLIWEGKWEQARQARRLGRKTLIRLASKE